MSTAPSRVLELVEQFHRNRDEYRKHGLNETQLRREYLDPFFEALGWDVANRQGHAPAYREVIHEDAVKIGGVEKAPDYSFRIGGTRKFFVEAKNPAVNLKDNPAPAYQLRRYAWSAKLPLSILSDFEEFVVYDCRTRPSSTDKTSAHRSLYLTYDQYESKWDEIASIFAKDAILKGSFDKYAAADRKRGTATVDAEFLAEIEQWREALAKNLAVRNPRLSVHDLNFAVQRTIDRIIFLRICEDRGAEHYGQLQALLNGEHTYGRLKQLFQQADDRYNSGLFHFRSETDRAEAPDELTPTLKIDDNVLQDILERLYAPKSPYEFSVFPAEILGQVYEQFLGKVIRLTAGHQAKVEEKPEVKKAGGVYYTPAYIVEYIVKQTVGALCKDKTPKQISTLRILDPACGSGSFLIGAYTYLMNYHRDWYVKDGPEKHKKELFQTTGGEWRLTTQEKKRILLNNLYGVDIDSQAVEVTKLSLLLKVLEGESDETLKRQLSFVKERALPDLGKNIKCGNSLIGPDYFTEQLLPDEDEMRRINPFDWNQGFPEVMKAGGFDAVIGNPPYIRMEAFKEIKNYLRVNYRAHEERADIYTYFLERGLLLLKSSGFLGMIVSNKFMKAKYGKPLRAVLSSRSAVQTIADFAGANVFEGATVRTIVLIAKPKQEKWTDELDYVPVPDSERLKALASGRMTLSEYAQQCSFSIDRSLLAEEGWQLLTKSKAGLLSRLRQSSLQLCEWLNSSASFGLKTGLNEAFVIDAGKRRELTNRDRSSSEIIKPILFGKDIRRYFIQRNRQWVIYCHPDRDIDDYPAVRKHLLPFRQSLLKRALAQKWYELQQPATHLIQVNALPKIVYPIIANECRFALDTDGYFINDKSFLLATDDLALLGLLNSQLANFYFSSVCAALEGSSDRYLEFRAQYVDRFPIPNSFREWSEKKCMTQLVQRMLDLHKRLAAAKNPNDQSRLQAQITATDREIDQLVCGLYGLTKDEIAIVEGKA